MDDSIPSLKLTDPSRVDRAPSLPTSPVDKKDTWTNLPERPLTSPFQDTQSDKNFATNPNATHGRASHEPQHFPISPSYTTTPTTATSTNTKSIPDAKVIDPLTRQILRRRQTAFYERQDERSRLERADAQDNDDEERPSSSEPGSSILQRADTIKRAAKDKRKGVSFLSRFIGNKKKPTEHDDKLGEEVASLQRDGAANTVFARSVDGMSTAKHSTSTPTYLKVRSKRKKRKDFEHLFLAQELRASGPSTLRTPTSAQPRLRKRSAGFGVPFEQDTIWTMQWSADGAYLATGGQDGIVRVWAVIISREERQHFDESAEISSSRSVPKHDSQLYAPVFRSEPVAVFREHEDAVLDLSWSKNDFLLSSSMDKTVRLWHLSRSKCLCTFKHQDYVTAIAFHPRDDRLFLAGSLDCRLRLWSISDKTVAFWAQVPEMITAVSFAPDGKQAIAGCLRGQCFFYETEGLKYQSQLNVQSNRDKSAAGSRITSISTVQSPVSGEVKILVTTNDSRLRLYNFRDKALELKLKGHVNESSLIRGHLSDDLRYVYTGSEDKRACMWSISSPDDQDRPEHWPCESFQAHDTIVTCVAFAPAPTRQLLERGEDPIYELCNATAAAPTPSESFDGTASVLSKPLDGRSIASIEHLNSTERHKSRHPDGNIIVTADMSGCIKVFRQDCAWRRRRAENLDASSTYGRRTVTNGRSASMHTKSSNLSLRSLIRDPKHGPDDRIMSWRQDIGGTASSSPRNRSIGGNGSIASGASASVVSLPNHRMRRRSHSPPHEPVPGIPGAQRLETGPATASNEQKHTNSNGIGRADPNADATDKTRFTPDLSRATTNSDLLMLQGEQSNAFWNIDLVRKQAERIKKAGLAALDVQRPSASRQESFVSKLSIDRSSSRGSERGRNQ